MGVSGPSLLTEYLYTVSGQTMSSSPSKHQEVPNIPQGYSKNKASSEETDEPSGKSHLYFNLYLNLTVQL